MAAKRKATQLTPAEKQTAARLKQLSPEEQKMQTKINERRIQQQNRPTLGGRTPREIGLPKLPESSPTKPTKPAKPTTAAGKAGRAYAQSRRAVVKAAQAAAPAAKAAGVVGRVAAPVVEGVRAARYLTDEGYRERVGEGFEDMSDRNAFLRAVEGGLGGITTIAAAAENLSQGAQARGRARAGEAAADAKTQELIARGILDESGRPIPLEQRRERIAATSQQMGPPAPQQMGPPAPQRAELPPSNVRPELPPSNVRPELPPSNAAEPAELERLFRTTMGGNFDPNSRVDREKMQKLQDFYTTSGGMGGRTPTRFALDYYKTLKY